MVKLPVCLGKSAGAGIPGTEQGRAWVIFQTPPELQSEWLPPQTSAHFDYTSPLPFHEDRLGSHYILGHYECEPEAGRAASQGAVPPAPVPCPWANPVHSRRLNISKDNQDWSYRGPISVSDIILHAEWATRTLSMKVRRDKWREREKALRWLVESGQGGFESISCQMGEILEQSICSLQARLSVSVYPVHFSCPLYLSLSEALWGENSVSVQHEGNGFSLLLDQEGGKEKTFLASSHCIFCKCPLLQLLSAKDTVPNFIMAGPLAPSLPRTEHSSPRHAHPSSPSSASFSR